MKFVKKLLSSKVQHVFFDLDHTLWDFDANALLTFEEMFVSHDLAAKLKVDAASFYEVYRKINDQHWAMYRKGKMSKEQLRVSRFLTSLRAFHLDDEALADEMNHFYVENSPGKKQLFPYALNVLTYLKNKGYALHIITNGFKEVQYRKLNNCELNHYFDEIIISEEAGAQKPHPAIFEYALNKAKAKASNSVMIGDNLLADIQGAINYGLHAVHFKPDAKRPLVQLKKYYRVNCLEQIREIL